MPPPISMGYASPNAGKMSDAQMAGHYSQYSSQYPQGTLLHTECLSVCCRQDRSYLYAVC